MIKNIKLISSLKKAGFDIQVDFKDTHLSAKNDSKIVEWIVQGENALCVNLRKISDESDMMVDYHSGYFAKSIKMAVEFLSKKGGE